MLASTYMINLENANKLQQFIFSSIATTHLNYSVVNSKQNSFLIAISRDQ